MKPNIFCLLLISIVFLCPQLNAQYKTEDEELESIFENTKKNKGIKRSWGIGLVKGYSFIFNANNTNKFESDFTPLGLSFKLGIKRSVVQLIIAPSSGTQIRFDEPFAASFSFYAGKYSYRFLNPKTHPRVDPYLYGLAGITYFYATNNNVSLSAIGLILGSGGGVEVIVGKRIGLFLEAGYLRIQGLSASIKTADGIRNESINIVNQGIALGFGAHYYLK